MKFTLLENTFVKEMKIDIFTLAPSGKTLSQINITPRQGETYCLSQAAC